MATTTESQQLIARRHPEWAENQIRWRWLVDSLEGGQRYRNAVYGTDTKGQPIRNLVRHKREYPDQRETNQGYNAYPVPLGYASQGQDPAVCATDDDYEMRRARTPIPTFVKEAVENDLSQIYSREVDRSGPDQLKAWWRDVDGCGTTVDRWMKETVADLILTLGGVDLIFDHPPAPTGETIKTQADTIRLGLNACVADYILPENMVWWKLRPDGRYAGCVVREIADDIDPTDPNSGVKYRHWTESGWTLYSSNGDQLSTGIHPYKSVPIVRVFDRKKKRGGNVPQSRYEGIAERQREYYNRDSELILSDTQQAHPLLQGPEDYVQADGTLPVGPSWLLPKKKSSANGTATYEGFDCVQFPKDGAESLRQNMYNIRQDVDRDAKLIQPSLISDSGKGQIEQSGISKSIDAKPASTRLIQIADALARVETIAAEFAMMVLSDGTFVPAPAAEDGIEIVYPASFDLYTASDVAVALSDFFELAKKTGSKGMEDIETAALERHVRLAMPCLRDEVYDTFDANIKAFIAAGGGQKAAMDMLTAKSALSPAGSVRNGVNDPTHTLQPPGQTGKGTTAKPDVSPEVK
jgi:hypothetical protein